MTNMLLLSAFDFKKCFKLSIWQTRSLSQVNAQTADFQKMFHPYNCMSVGASTRN